MGHDGLKIDSKEISSHCQVCGEALSTAPMVLCKKCGTPHHRECWRYNRGCAVYGCACKIFVLPSSAQSGDSEIFTIKGSTNPAHLPFYVIGSVLCLLLGIFAAINIHPAFGLLGGFAYGLCLTMTILYHQKGFYLLTFDRVHGVVHRRLCIWDRLRFSEEREWLRADDIAEVHLQKFDESMSGSYADLNIAKTDGSRLLIKRVSLGAAADQKLEQLEKNAEAIAVFADTTVRFIEADQVPTAEEIKQAADEKLIGSEPGALSPVDKTGPSNT